MTAQGGGSGPIPSWRHEEPVVVCLSPIPSLLRTKAVVLLPLPVLAKDGYDNGDSLDEAVEAAMLARNPMVKRRS